jgi:hypothetical protein
MPNPSCTHKKQRLILFYPSPLPVKHHVVGLSQSYHKGVACRKF